jgi:hypothetical protein
MAKVQRTLENRPLDVDYGENGVPSVLVGEYVFRVGDQVAAVAIEDLSRVTQTLAKILSTLKTARDRWCAEEVDDAEEMWIEIPEMLDEIVPELESTLLQIEGSHDR